MYRWLLLVMLSAAAVPGMAQQTVDPAVFKALLDTAGNEIGVGGGLLAAAGGDGGIDEEAGAGQREAGHQQQRGHGPQRQERQPHLECRDAVLAHARHHVPVPVRIEDEADRRDDEGPAEIAEGGASTSCCCRAHVRPSWLEDRDRVEMRSALHAFA